MTLFSFNRCPRCQSIIDFCLGPGGCPICAEVDAKIYLDVKPEKKSVIYWDNDYKSL
jgi:hypothetical protein